MGVKSNEKKGTVTTKTGVKRNKNGAVTTKMSVIHVWKQRYSKNENCCKTQ